MKKLLLILLMCFALPNMAGAMKNEPDGFRGIKFGSHFDLVKNEMKLYVDAGDLPQRFYHRKNDKLVMNNAVIEFIDYGYYKNQFYDVGIGLWGLENCQKFFASIKNSYGNPDSTEKTKEGGQRFKWSGKNVRIDMIFTPPMQGFPDTARVQLLMAYTPIENEIIELRAQMKK